MTEEWNAAFIGLVQENNFVALANLLRRVMPISEGGPANIPVEVVYEIAEVFDPRSSINRFAKPPDFLPVKLKVTAITRSHLDRIKRDQRILGEVMVLIEQGQSVSEAAVSVGAMHNLSERHVTEIWSTARDAFAMLDLPRKARRKTTGRRVR